MDSLGKIVDWAVLLIVLFIFPVNWALGSIERIADESLRDIADAFLEEACRQEGIDDLCCEKLEYELSVLPKYYRAEISVKRHISVSDYDVTSDADNYTSIIGMTDIESGIKADGNFRLVLEDVLVLKLYDRDALFLVISKRID